VDFAFGFEVEDSCAEVTDRVVKKIVVPLVFGGQYEAQLGQRLVAAVREYL
jgi:hypothetical protein